MPKGPVRVLPLLTALLVFCLAEAGVRPLGAAETERLWTALRNGVAVAIMRHALAPGTGDPADFDPHDCATQRNLSEFGRGQAKRIGDRFRENGIAGADVRSSAWCRTAETAELLGLGEVKPLAPLNSFYAAREREGPQTAELKSWLAGRAPAGPAVLVTHQVNITALTGVFPVSGQIVVVRPEQGGGVTVLGSIRPQNDANTSRCDCGEKDE